MSKLVCVRLEKQDGKPVPVRPQAGEPVYLAVDLSRSKWVYGLRWGGQERRCVRSPYGLAHVQALVEEYRDCQLHVVYEAFGLGYEKAWWLEEQAIDVMVIAPSRVKRVP